MSVGAITWALQQDVRPPACKFVLVILANWADRQDNFSYPGDDAIAESASLRCTKTVRAHIEALVSAGLIRHGKGYDREGQIRNGYILECPSADGKTFPATEKNSIGLEKNSNKSEKFSAPIEDTKDDTKEDTSARARDLSASRAEVAPACQATDVDAAVEAPWASLSHLRLVQAVAARRAERGTTVRMAGITQAERQAADAYLDAVERGEIEDAAGLAAPHACDVWRRHELGIKTAVGEKAWRSWLGMLTPLGDDGVTLTMAAPSRLIAGVIEREHAELIGKIVARKIAIEVRAWAGPAANARAEREALTSGTAA
jgi:hypothetical protein